MIIKKAPHAPLGAVGGGMAALPPWWEAHASFDACGKSGMSRRRGGVAGSAWPLGGMCRKFSNARTEGERISEFPAYATAMRREPAVNFLLGIW